MAKTIAQALLWGALCIFLLFALGGTVYMAGLSMVTWWKPLVICAVIGIFSAPLQQFVKAKMSLWLRCLIQAVAVTITCPPNNHYKIVASAILQMATLITVYVV